MLTVGASTVREEWSRGGMEECLQDGETGKVVSLWRRKVGRGVKPIKKQVQVVGPVHIPLHHCLPLFFFFFWLVMVLISFYTILVAVLSLCKLDVKL